MFIVFMFNFFKITLCDVPRFWQLGLQDPATPMAIGMLFFHNYLMMYIIFIGCFVFFMLFSAYETNSKYASKFSHSNLLEIIWTVIPALSLIIIAIPSFSLLYSLDDIVDPQMTVKIVGHQWYWSYEYSDRVSIKLGTPPLCVRTNYDAYMAITPDSCSEFEKKWLRLLSTDHVMLVPIKTHIRLLVTSADVLHSWAVPAFGIKIDATPGRLSQVSLFLKRAGTFYGQCSEICGVNHGFMPIMVKAARVTKESQFGFLYMLWMQYAYV